MQRTEQQKDGGKSKEVRMGKLDERCRSEEVQDSFSGSVSAVVVFFNSG